jgi:hypothetical protein
MVGSRSNSSLQNRGGNHFSSIIYHLVISADRPSDVRQTSIVSLLWEDLLGP